MAYATAASSQGCLSGVKASFQYLLFSLAQPLTHVGQGPDERNADKNGHPQREHLRRPCSSDTAVVHLGYALLRRCPGSM